jgi:hypothetical protein
MDGDLLIENARPGTCARPRGCLGGSNLCGLSDKESDLSRVNPS